MKRSEDIIQFLALTEKGTRLGEKGNQYLFNVDPSANKIEIKRAVEELFKVKVDRVNTMVRPGKLKRSRRMDFGRTSGFKRAVVTLHEGETIDLT